MPLFLVRLFFITVPSVIQPWLNNGGNNPPSLGRPVHHNTRNDGARGAYRRTIGVGTELNFVPEETMVVVLFPPARNFGGGASAGRGIPIIRIARYAAIG